jgi:hypothetical protein
MKAYGEVDIQVHVLMALAGCERPLYPRGKKPPVHIGCEVGWTTAGLDDVEKKDLDHIGTRTQPHGRPTRSQSLYRLRYPGSSISTML